MLPDLTNELCCELNIFAFLSVFVKVFHQVYWLLVLTVQATQQRNADRVYCCLKWRAFQLNMWMRCHSQINSCSVCVCIYVLRGKRPVNYTTFIRLRSTQIWFDTLKWDIYLIASRVLTYSCLFHVLLSFTHWSNIIRYWYKCCVYFYAVILNVSLFLFIGILFIVIIRVHFRLHTENRSNENKK